MAIRVLWNPLILRKPPDVLQTDALQPKNAKSKIG